MLSMDKRLLRCVIVPFAVWSVSACVFVFILSIKLGGVFVGVGASAVMIIGFLKSGLLRPGENNRIVYLCFVLLCVFYILSAMTLAIYF